MFKRLNFILSELRKFYIPGGFIESKDKKIINSHCNYNEKYGGSISIFFKLICEIN